MKDIPTFTTAKAFNEASKAAGWGLEIVQREAQWVLCDREQNILASSAKESDVAIFGGIHIASEPRTE